MTTEITLKEIIDARWDDLPVELQQVFHGTSYATHIDTIAGYYHLTEKQKRVLKNEIDLIIFLFEPLSHLAENLMKNLVIERSTADQIVSEIKLGILFGHTDTLTEIEQLPDFVSLRSKLIKQQSNTTGIPKPSHRTHEELELRPEGVSSDFSQPAVTEPQPLTRDEVLRALASRRTMPNDIDSLRHTQE